MTRKHNETQIGDVQANPATAPIKPMKLAQAALDPRIHPGKKMENPAPMSVWLIEDNENFRDTLSRVVNDVNGMECIHEFSNAEDALKLLYAGEIADVILLDVGLPGKNGIEAIGEIKSLSPTTRIIMLTAFDDHKKVFKAVCAGASGYLLKPSNTDQIVRAIQEANSGGAPMSPQVARSVLDMLSGRSVIRSDLTLTAREQDVLRLMAQGLGMRGVADELHLSYHTVDFYLRNVYAKLHVHTSSAAVAKAYKEGLL